MTVPCKRPVTGGPVKFDKGFYGCKAEAIAGKCFFGFAAA